MELRTPLSIRCVNVAAPISPLYHFFTYEKIVLETDANFDSLKYKIWIKNLTKFYLLSIAVSIDLSSNVQCLEAPCLLVFYQLLPIMTCLRRKTDVVSGWWPEVETLEWTIHSFGRPRGPHVAGACRNNWCPVFCHHVRQWICTRHRNTRLLFTA